MKVMFIVYHDIKVEARTQELLEAVKRLGDTYFVSYSMPFDCSGIHTYHTGRRNYLTFILGAFIALIRYKPDVVVLHDNYTAVFLKWLHVFSKDTIIIYDSSELYIDHKPSTLKGRIAHIMQVFENRNLKYADIVISANMERSKIMKEYFKLKSLPIVFDNIHKINDKYDIEECDKKYSQYFNGSFSIVYAGGVSKQRMTYELAEAVGELGLEYRLLILGEGNEEEIGCFYKFLEKRGISNVHYFGFKPRCEWRYFLHKASISVVAFAHDTLNNIYCASGKLYESLFEGIPILTSENPPLKRICEGNGVGVSTNKFKEGIIEIRNNYDKYKQNIVPYINSIDFEKRIDILVKELESCLRNIGIPG